METEPKKKNLPIRHRFPLITILLTLAYYAFVILVTMFSDEIDLALICLCFPLMFVIGTNGVIGVLTGLIASVLYLAGKAWRGRHRYWGYYVPLVLGIGALAITTAVPLKLIGLQIRLDSNFDAYNTVAKMVLDDNVIHRDFYRLPDEYCHLSDGCQIFIDTSRAVQRYIYFYTFDGIPDPESGFVYSPDNRVPPFGEVHKRMHPKWFYMTWG